MPVAYPKAFQYHAARLAKDIQAAGATPVFFMTWARKHIPKMQEGLTKEYTTAAKKAGGLLAPVGEAFKACRAKHPKIELYADDKSHPSRAGSYLATCVIYATLYNDSPEGLPARVVDGKKVLMSLKKADAAALQKIAWQTIQKAPRPTTQPAVEKQ